MRAGTAEGAGSARGCRPRPARSDRRQLPASGSQRAAGGGARGRNRSAEEEEEAAARRQRPRAAEVEPVPGASRACRSRENGVLWRLSPTKVTGKLPTCSPVNRLIISEPPTRGLPKDRKTHRLSSRCMRIVYPKTHPYVFSVGTVAFFSESDHPSLLPKTQNKLYNFFWVCRSKFRSRSWGNARIPLERGGPFLLNRGRSGFGDYLEEPQL
ncbi:uncharacterized protein LOC128811935 [Vidua macroura]|uniref:uncharacterized protein LOC128811935 n=1 Tax=Vidua macroura TaxID=187451 RepID=UPI0023A90B61|nr:uncharacterized protein LOC128811935 [Vidua macroura]